MDGIRATCRVHRGRSPRRQGQRRPSPASPSQARMSFPPPLFPPSPSKARPLLAPSGGRWCALPAPLLPRPPPTGRLAGPQDSINTRAPSPLPARHLPPPSAPPWSQQRRRPGAGGGPAARAHRTQRTAVVQAPGKRERGRPEPTWIDLAPEARGAPRASVSTGRRALLPTSHARTPDDARAKRIKERAIVPLLAAVRDWEWGRYVELLGRFLVVCGGLCGGVWSLGGPCPLADGWE